MWKQEDPVFSIFSTVTCYRIQAQVANNNFGIYYGAYIQYEMRLKRIA